MAPLTRSFPTSRPLQCGQLYLYTCAIQNSTISVVIRFPAPCPILRAGTKSRSEVWEFIHIEALAKELEEY